MPRQRELAVAMFREEFAVVRLAPHSKLLLPILQEQIWVSKPVLILHDKRIPRYWNLESTLLD